MHPFDDNEMTTLEVIDATLAGEAVEPEYAELAELTLILAGQRPVPRPAFTDALDDRVARRFARARVVDTAACAPAMAVRSGRRDRSSGGGRGCDRGVRGRGLQRPKLGQLQHGGAERSAQGERRLGREQFGPTERAAQPRRVEQLRPH